MSLPASIAAMVGRIPIIPTMAVTRISDSGCAATSRSPSIPDTIFTSRSAVRILSSFAFSSVHTAASGGRNSLICLSSRSILEPAANAVISRSPLFLATSRVCVPMEPVDPSIAIFFIYFLLFLPAYTRRKVPMIQTEPPGYRSWAPSRSHCRNGPEFLHAQVSVSRNL